MFPNTDEAEVARVLETFVHGWNAADGTTLARAFAPDADFTNIMGLHARGRAVIARGHDEILETVFRDTELTATVDQVRFLRPDVAVVDASLALQRTDGGPFHGPGRSRVKLVATKEPDGWTIASFNNMIPFERPTAGPVERSLAEAPSKR